MPLYDYDCQACGRRVEVVHGVHAPGPTHCPTCGSGPLKKAIAAPAVHFKGSGWAKKERRATVAPGASKAGEGSNESDGDGKGGDGEGSDGKGGDGKGDRKGGEGKSGEGKGSGGSGSSSSGSNDTASDRPAAESRSTPSKSAGSGTATKTD